MQLSPRFELKAINTIRFLALDAVQKANSGHPGLPMGAAALAYALWTRHLRHNPTNPKWSNRDRFILSGGHGSMLLYSLLLLNGYDLSMDDIQSFRQWESRIPGHPEYGLTPGVETTTDPLGQGFTNGVGMAIAEPHLAAEFNRPGYPIVDHYTYAIVTDGDLMEGVASEAASLAGHFRLGKLIYLYDNNRISIEGSTDLVFIEDCGKRFEAYGWQVLYVADGNDVDAIDQAILKAKEDPRPSLIICQTRIGYGLPTRQDNAKAHGEPPGQVELNGAKTKLGWPLETSFLIPPDIREFFIQAIERGINQEANWQSHFDAYKNDFPEQAIEFKRRMKRDLPVDWWAEVPVFRADPKGIATRSASGKVLNALVRRIPELVGGSADLQSSTMTWLDGSPAFQASTPEGRNFHFGVREHAMGGIVNGMALHGGLIPYGSTFLVFADYMRPPIRISALSQIPSIWIFTHDSIGVGEEGPTHQPVEQLASLRAIPSLTVIRPADANEVAEAWKVIIEHRNGPTILTLTRQTLPVLDRQIFAPASELARGAYVLADVGDDKPELILMASGSEVSLIVEAGMRLAAEGVNVRLVSFPSLELFEAQDEEYRQSVFPSDVKARLAVEAEVGQGWEKWIGTQGKLISIECFGASAPARDIFEKLGFSVEAIMEKASGLIHLTL